MRIAITGGSGFIGKWFIKEFGGKYKCVIFGRKKDINELKIAGEKYKYIRTDFSNDQLVRQLEGFDAVIHLAAIKYTKDRTRLSDYEDNIRISENLLKVCSQLNISNFVFASTRSIYSDKFNKIPFLENENVFP